MNAEEYNKCVENYSDGLYRFLLKSIKDIDKARDVVQDTYEKLWVRIDNVDFEKAKSYLFTVAYHGMIDMIRRDKFRAGMESLKPSDLSTNKQYSDLKEILELAISKLPEIQKTVILLRDYEGYSYDEIGEITSLNESQVKVYIFRARTFLKEFIGKMDNVI